MVALRGSLAEFGLGDVLALLGATGQTGALVLEAQGEAARVYTTAGLVAHAHFGEDDALDAMVRAQIVDLSHVEAAVAEPGGWADALCRRSRADRAALGTWLRERIEDALFQVTCWPTGTFEFRVGETHAAGGGCAFEVDPLLVGAERKRAQWRDITASLGSVDLVPVLNRWLPTGAGAITLDPEEWYVLSAIDGRRSVRAMARELGETLFGVAQTVRTMVDGGLARMDGDDPVDLAAEPAELVAVLTTPHDLDLGIDTDPVFHDDDLLADPSDSTEPASTWTPIGMRDGVVVVPADDDPAPDAEGPDGAGDDHPLSDVDRAVLTRMLSAVKEL